MGKLIIFWLVTMLLALNCRAAEPVQLSGIGGQTILAQIASANITNQVTKASAADLWSWGKIPLNYALNESGKIFELPSIDDDNIWRSTKSTELGLEMQQNT